MAKTRIKMTPLRTAKTLGTSTGGGGGGTGSTKVLVKPQADSTTIELIDSSGSGGEQPLQKEPEKKSVTTITAVPQRSHSISSSASSDVQSISSEYETSLPLSDLVNAEAKAQAQAKAHVQAQAEKNGLGKKRKLYVITEKQSESNGSNSNEKRKMFVVVEQEKESAAKKLMIVTDKPQANITEHLEKILPELLSCIQDKQAKQQQQQTLSVKPKPTTKPPITLPPKKNPTNFGKASPSPLVVTLPAAAPSPVESFSASSPSSSEVVDETNINLSPDFRFLMKILPKLEGLPEPHKQNVKRSIQIFVEKSYSIYGKKE